MKKEPSLLHLNERPPIYFGVRGAVVLVLAGIGIGVCIDQYFADDKSHPKPPAATDVSEGQSDLNNDENIRPSRLVSDIRFDKNPLDYVNVDQCRQLLFKATGDSNCKNLTVDEMRQKIHGEETEERLVIAEDAIDRFCISNSVDQDAIRNAMLNGCTRLGDDPISGGIYDFWYINLEDPSGEYCESVDLNEEPPCARPLTDEEEKIKQEMEDQAERVKVMIDSIRNNQFDDILADIDIQELENEVRDKGVEEGIGGELVDMLKRTKSKLKGKMSSTERKILACEIISFVISVDLKEIDQTDESTPDDESSLEPEGGPIMEKAFESMEELAESLFKAEGLEDAEECLLYMYKR